MSPVRAAASKQNLRMLPSVDELIRTATAIGIAESAGQVYTAKLARRVIDEYRAELSSRPEMSKAEVLAEIEKRLDHAWQREQLTGTRRVINATGVIIHTNLGRAPLSANARQAVADAAGYCTLEYDLDTGKRGRRAARAEKQIVELTGAEDTLIVNNCAAAAFFVLTVFAAGGEVVISRGELVEIGGDFRIPDVLSQSGAELREVGTTNRTKLADYEKAITERTRLILRVHPSNYRIVGFTAMPDAAELAEFAHRHKLIIYEDLGSGAIVDFADLGLGDEPVAAKSIESGVDIITFSGDKLLGGPQAGIIAGKSELIAKLRNHPLYRVLRADKLTYAAVEATLAAYIRGTAREEIPVMQMLSQTSESLAKRVQDFVERLNKGPGKNNAFKLEVVDGQSAIGGGAAPGVGLETSLIAITHSKMTPIEIEKRLRASQPPVIARILDNRVVLDLRTVPEEDEPDLINAIRSEPPGERGG